MLSVILGVIVCVAASKVNDIFIDLLRMDDDRYVIFGAPLVEELLKFCAVCIFGLIVKKGKRGSTANAFAVGVGFCVVENFCYLFSDLENANVFWIISRGIGTGLMHCMTSALYGVALFSVKGKSKWQKLQIFCALLGGVVFHGGYNALVQFDGLRVIGVLMPVCAFVLLFYFIKGTELHNYLWDKEGSEK